MFHPDNIKNLDAQDFNVGVSLARYFKKYGGTEGIAKLLKTDLKVSITTKRDTGFSKIRNSD